MSNWLVYGVPVIAVLAAIVGNFVLFASSRAFDRKWSRRHPGE